MSEDSLLRLENAMATLAEISAQHNERLAAHEERLAAIERTNQRLRELTTDHQQLIANTLDALIYIVRAAVTISPTLSKSIP